MKARWTLLAMAIAPMMVVSGSLADDMVPSSSTRAPIIVEPQQKVLNKRVSQYIGRDVFDGDAKQIGSVKDIVLDGGIQRISYVVVSYGGVLGVGDKLFAIPWSAIEARPGQPDRVYITLKSESLKKAPGFDKEKWPNMADPALRQMIDSYYQAHAQAGDKSIPLAAAVAKRSGPNKEGLLWCRRATAVIGADVRNTANENLGDIEDLVVDYRSGQIRYAVLSFGGLFGVGDKLFAIPVTSLQTRADDEKFVLNLSKSVLKAAPGFDRDHWPDFADPQFGSTISEYYNPKAGIIKPLAEIK